MESDPNPFPEFNLGIKDKAYNVAKKVIGLCTLFPPEAPLYMSNHYRGASEMLDHHLNEPLDGEAMEGYAEVADQLRLPILEEGWDSLGQYIDKSEYEG